MSIDSFEKILQEDYKVFVDTSSLMQPESEVVFFKLIAPLLHKYDKKLILPQSVLNEVENHNKNNHKDIFRANNILTELANHGLYGKSSKFNESFADNAIAAQFLELRLKYNLCLITNDNSHKKDGNLSEDIINLKKSRSVDKIKDIRVFYIKNQTLFEYKSKSSEPLANSNHCKQLISSHSNF